MSRITKARYIFSRRVKIKLIFLFLGVIAGAQIETLTLSIMQPFVMILADPSIVYTNQIIDFIFRTFGFGSTSLFLAFFAAVIALVYVFRGLFIYFFARIQNWFTATNTAKLSNSLLMQTLEQPYLYHANNNAVALQRVVIKNSERLFGLISNIILLLSDGFMSLFILIFLMFSSFSMTLVILFFALICIIVYFKIYKGRITQTGEDEARGIVLINKSVLQSLHGIKEIKVMQSAPFFIQKFRDVNQNTIKTRAQVLSLLQLPKLFIESLCFSGAFLVVGGIILYGVDMQTLLPQLGVFVLAAFKLLPAISRITNNTTRVMRLLPSVDQVYSGLFEQDTEFESPLPEPTKVGSANLDILISKVTFMYPKARKPVLKKVSLKIPHNKSVAIVGPSGAGKSTLVDIIIGILNPQQGYVIYNGHSIHHNSTEWLQNVGYIPQAIYLLDETILENIAFGVDKDNIDEESVWCALEQAQLKEYVMSLPDGLQTMVGERGVRLSGGQRQRIGIARALYRNPSVLVLDEATSSLDNDTESAVMDAIKGLKGSKTVIIVAHRLSTIEHCDIVFEVKKRTVTQLR
ncbi:MAG: ABC transporter ATP-binding protein/permease [Defluviitaleaceae bacterium]|nr:ABC transporter ATP-binding protein/permease [Defluviitaleaceae bacterium]